MTSRWKSAVTGALVAAALTLPAIADNWIVGPTKNFNARAVSVHDVVGSLTIAVRDDGPATVQLSGSKTRVDATSVRQDGGTLVVVGQNFEQVWDWRHWFDFSGDYSRGSLNVKITLPRGSEVKVDDLIGDAEIGDTMGPLHFSAVSTNSTIGRVSDAHISLAGSGRVALGDVAGDLQVETAGAGKIITGNAKSVRADVAGSGAIETGAINGSLSLDIAGSGDFSAQRVSGPTRIDIAGSGSVRIANGEADPLHVDILGSGNVVFGGTAVDPHISGFGSGSVKLHAMRGQLHNDGMANVKIGD
jgi:hypothetical protein